MRVLIKYKQEQLNQVIELINNLEFVSGKNIQNAQRVLGILQILNDGEEVQKVESDEDLITK